MTNRLADLLRSQYNKMDKNDDKVRNRIFEIVNFVNAVSHSFTWLMWQINFLFFFFFGEVQNDSKLMIYLDFLFSHRYTCLFMSSAKLL